ncbi:hypothetical protein GCM10028798_12290 [Humibacter antri]
MIGALTTTLLLALCAVMAIHPPMPRFSSPFNLQFGLGWWVNEAPLLGLWWLVAGSTGALLAAPSAFWWWSVAGLMVVDGLLLVLIAVRARSTRTALSAAFQDAYGPDGVPRYTQPAWWRLVLPVLSWRPDVRRIRNRRYGPSRRGNRLDVYVSRRRRTDGAPVLVYVHGGAFVLGSKMLGSRALLYRLAAQGWVCISIDHRLFRVQYADQLADVRAALTWVRANARSYGGSPEAVFVAGGSSGAHLAATATLSGTEVRGVIAFYGYYGSVGRSRTGPTSPQDCINPDAPPFLIVHGTVDTLVLRRDARDFASRLRAVSRRPVVYAELPGAQHNFDFFQSLRFHAVTDAVVRFTELTIGADGARSARPAASNAGRVSSADVRCEKESGTSAR